MPVYNHFSCFCSSFSCQSMFNQSFAIGYTEEGDKFSDI
jgi:hypothetical protein